MKAPKEVNEELESDPPRWCSEHGRWDCDEHDEDLSLDKVEATTQWFDELQVNPADHLPPFPHTVHDRNCECNKFSARGNNAGGEDVCLPALSPAPPQTLSPPCPGTKIPSGVGRGSLSDGGKPLQLDYPAWRLTFSAYGQHIGVEVPEERVWDGEDAEEWQRRSERECDYTEIV